MASSLLSDCSSCATSRLLPLRRALHPPPPPRFRPSPAPAPARTRPLFADAPLPLLPRTRRMAALSAAADPATVLADASAKIIDGKLVAKQIRDEVGVEIARMKEATGVVPGLAVILVGERKDSQTYVRNKKKACEAVGIKSYEVNLPEDCSEYEVIKNIATFNDDPSVHGILVQLPLPRHMNDENILNAVSIEKDVDGFHPLNIGRLAMQGRDPFFVPCTPKGCMELLHRYGVEIKGKRAVVIGRSNIVGMPAALLLQDNGGCNFFEWCDASPPGLANARSNTGFQSDASVVNMPCSCGAGTCLILTTKNGINVGRQFYRCPAQGGSSCGFFKWCDDQQQLRTAAPPQQAASPQYQTGVISTNQNMSKMSSGCFKCGQENHWAKDCPNQSSDPYSDKGGRTSTPATSSDGCFKCGKAGHWSRDCPVANSGGGGAVASHAKSSSSPTLGAWNSRRY